MAVDPSFDHQERAMEAQDALNERHDPRQQQSNENDREVQANTMVKTITQSSLNEPYSAFSKSKRLTIVAISSTAGILSTISANIYFPALTIIEKVMVPVIQRWIMFVCGYNNPPVLQWNIIIGFEYNHRIGKFDCDSLHDISRHITCILGLSLRRLWATPSILINNHCLYGKLYWSCTCTFICSITSAPHATSIWIKFSHCYRYVYPMQSSYTQVQSVSILIMHKHHIHRCRCD